MNDILDADDVAVADLALDELVAGDGQPLAVHLDEAALVEQLTHRGQARVAVGDVRLGDTQHVDGGLGIDWGGVGVENGKGRSEDGCVTMLRNLHFMVNMVCSESDLLTIQVKSINSIAAKCEMY